MEELTPDADIVNWTYGQQASAGRAHDWHPPAQFTSDQAEGREVGCRRFEPCVTRCEDTSRWRESSDPIKAEKKELRETNNLVEEFMLLANVSVAQKIQETFPQTAVLQQQMPPPKENSEKLQDILMKRRGLSLDVSRSGALAVSLDLCLNPSEPAFNTLVRIMATRCMLSAEYFSSGGGPSSTSE
ncbi:exosome catalytic subunit dis3 [Pleurotus pulmonarius]|nr:exosome catalytic subunit dis3 [Pleurotus pulmonarius]